MEYYLVIKKNTVLKFVSIWVDLVVMVLSEINQTEKNKCNVISLICGIRENKPNEQTNQKQTHRYRD